MRGRLLAILGISGLALIAGPAHAEQDPSSQPTTGALRSTEAVRPGRVVIDGARNPELIKDESVIPQLLQMWAIPANADAAEERRFEAMTSRMQLGPNDLRVLRTELAEAFPVLNGARTQIRATTDASQARSLMTQAQAAALETYGRLLEFMSADGRAKLRGHIEYIKTRTKVVTSAPSAPIPPTR